MNGTLSLRVGRVMLLALCVAGLAQPLARAESLAPATRAGGGMVYKATPPPPYGESDTAAPAMPAAGSAGAPVAGGDTPSRVTTANGAAPVVPGAAVDIISGGAGSANGAAKVGRMPVLQ